LVFFFSSPRTVGSKHALEVETTWSPSSARLRHPLRRSTAGLPRPPPPLPATCLNPGPSLSSPSIPSVAVPTRGVGEGVCEVAGIKFSKKGCGDTRRARRSKGMEGKIRLVAPIPTPSVASPWLSCFLTAAAIRVGWVGTETGRGREFFPDSSPSLFLLLVRTLHRSDEAGFSLISDRNPPGEGRTYQRIQI
jgi:hypothetical protein